MKLNDKLAHGILVDHTDFKLTITKKFLKNLTFEVPYNLDQRHFHLEFCAEGFLLFANSVIEILTYEINAKFKLFSMEPHTIEYTSYEDDIDDQHKYWLMILNKGGKTDKFYNNFSIYDIRDDLKKLDPEQKQIFDLIQNYFQYPQKNSEWDFSKSTLWQLRELRNHVAHDQILNTNSILGAKSQYIFRFKPYRGKRFQVVRVVNNPRQYFEDMFRDLVDFRNEIRKIVPHNMPSSQYSNQIDFGLNF